MSFVQSLAVAIAKKPGIPVNFDSIAFRKTGA